MALLTAVLRNVGGQRAQRGEDAVVVGVVGAQLDAVFFRDRHRHLQHVDRIEPEALLAAFRRQLPRYMVPAEIVVRSELPRSPNGKFDRVLLREELTA